MNYSATSNSLFCFLLLAMSVSAGTPSPTDDFLSTLDSWVVTSAGGADVGKSLNFDHVLSPGVRGVGAGDEDLGEEVTILGYHWSQ